MHRLAIIVAAAGSLAVAAPLRAQRADTTRNKVPENQRPPAGMCRIWLDNVPAGQQPAPTDCATAIRHRPPNGHVVFGEPVQTPLVERRVTPKIERGTTPPVTRDSASPVGRHPHPDSTRPQARPLIPQKTVPAKRDTSGRPGVRGRWRME